MINKLAKSLFGHCHKQLGFKNPPRLFLKKDQENAGSALGKTAYYNPGESSITVYITGRHIKDVLRSIAHELIHHHQNERGDLTSAMGEAGPGYAQNNKDLRKMEEEAYLQGNMLFRDWEDSCKAKFQMEENTMNMQLKDLKKLIQKSILEVLNKEEETVTEEENNNEIETVMEEEEVETVTEEENNEADTVTEGWGGSSTARISSSSGASSEKTYAGARAHEREEPVKSSGHGTHSSGAVTAAMEKACANEVGASGGYDYRECLRKRKERYEESKNVGAEGDIIGENEKVIDEMGKAYKRDDKKEKEIKEAEKEETFEESKVMTPEREAALKENYMGAKRANLFERLSKKWAK